MFASIPWEGSGFWNHSAWSYGLGVRRTVIENVGEVVAEAQDSALMGMGHVMKPARKPRSHRPMHFLTCPCAETSNLTEKVEILGAADVVAGQAV